jgi:hypothetical protein
MSHQVAKWPPSIGLSNNSRSCSMTGFKVLLLSNVVLMYEDVFVAFEDARFNAIMPSCCKLASLLSGLDSRLATQLIEFFFKKICCYLL